MRQLLDGTRLDDMAMNRLQGFEAEALAKHPAGYWLAFSGGKDSVVILDLAKRAGVKFEANYSMTTVDPPELVKFIRTFPEVTVNRPPLSMWRLIRKKQRPPTRVVRYCCQELKERGGEGRVVVTGVRWAESANRSKRQMMEACYRKGSDKKLLHPIIDWSTTDVWDYIRSRSLAYSSLYDEGWKRVGCVLCPMSRHTARDLARWPKLCRAWERNVKATWTDKDRWPTAEVYWRWWLDRDASGKVDTDPVLFEDDPDAAEEGPSARGPKGNDEERA